MHIYAKNEHAGITERSILTIKELARATCHEIIFKTYTSITKRSIIEGLLYLLTRLPSKGGVYDTLILSAIS